MAAVDDRMLDELSCSTPNPRKVIAWPVAFRVCTSRSSTPSVDWISVVLPTITVPVNFRPAVPVPPWSFRVMAPLVVKVPRLLILLRLSVTTPASPLSVVAEMTPVVGVWLTVPVSSRPSIPRDTVPAVAEITFSVALVALTISMALAPALSVVSVPLTAMLYAPPPPSMRMLPPAPPAPALSAFTTEALNWLTPCPPRKISPAANTLLAPSASVPVAPSPVVVRNRMPPALIRFWVRFSPEVES